MSVNLSARQFAHPDLVATFGAILDGTGADPSRLAWRSPRRALMEDVEAVDRDAAGAEGARRRRCRSTTSAPATRRCAYLQRFPVDVVKIDRSFVAPIEHDPQEAAIVAAVISLSHALGLRTVAEGIETIAQVDRLRGLGCDLAQGFYFAKPGPAEDVRR